MCDCTFNTYAPAPRDTEQKTDETSPPVTPKNRALQLDVSQMLGLEKSPGNELEESPYADVDFSKKTPKKNLNSDSRVDDQSLKESPYEEDIYEDPENLDLDKTLTQLSGELIPIPITRQTDGK